MNSNIDIVKLSESTNNLYKLKNVGYEIKVNIDSSPLILEDGASQLDYIFRTILQKVKNEEAPKHDYKIGTRISIPGQQVENIFIEFRKPDLLNEDVILNRFFKIIQSNQILHLKTFYMYFTFFNNKK